MKFTLLFTSFVLNVVLAVICLRPDGNSKSSTETVPAKTKVLTKTVIEEVAAPIEANVVQNVSEEPFHWSSIQSTNFADYAEQLREMGCPAQTIRDIIGGEINDWTLVERRAIIAPHAPRFWEYAAKGDFDIPEELKKPLSDLKKKRQEMLAAALKNIPKAEPTPRSQSRNDETLAMLPPEKLEQIKALDGKYAALRKEVNQNKDLSATDKGKKLQELQNALEKEKQGMMSAEELAEYKLRRESWVFQNLYGFKTDQEEMRKIAAVYAENSNRSSDAVVPITAEERNASEQRRDEELKALLGEARFAEFKRGSDNSYRLLSQLALAYKLPEETAHRAYELTVAFNEEVGAIGKHPSMTPEQKAAALQELEDEVDDATVTILGEKAARSYQKLFPSR